MYIYLDIVRDFRCQLCGTCCRNDWLVTLDEASYQRNRELFAGCGCSAEFAAAFTCLTGRQRPGEYAVINKQAGACWFLESDNRCRLHAQAGHDHLDSVCQTFPRYPMDTSRGLELTLSFSCPAVMKLVERVQPLTVLRADSCPLSVREDVPTAQVYPEQQPLGQPLRDYFELEHHFIDILQWRGLPMGERLALLAETAARLDALPTGDATATRRQLDQIIGANYEFLDAQGMVAPADTGVTGGYFGGTFLTLIWSFVKFSICMACCPPPICFSRWRGVWMLRGPA